MYSLNFAGKQSVVPTIVKRFQAQRHRGTSGFGFYIPDKDRLTHNVKEGRIISLLKRHEDAKEVMFHHRIPTSTANVRNACHPFSTKNVFENQYIVMHNGVLRNEDTLKAEHDKLGIKYISVQPNGRFNDSEALAYDLGRFLEGDVDKISAAGTIAFIVIKRDKAGKATTLFFGRNHGNPLKMKKTGFSLTLSSEAKHDEKDYVDVEANTLYSYSYDTGQLTKRPCIIPAGYSTTYGAGYSGTGYHSRSTAPVRTVIDQVDGDDDDELSKLGESWDSQSTLDGVEATFLLNEEIASLKSEVLDEASDDKGVALAITTDRLEKLRKRNDEIDEIANSDDETESETALEMVNEYCINEDTIGYLEQVQRELRLAMVEEAKKELSASTQMGFQPPHAKATAPTAISSGRTYQVPKPERETKKVGTGYPFVD